MRKIITVNWLNKINACSDAVEAFKNQKETNPIKVVQGAMKINRFDWANWLIVRLMNRKQKIQYAIFAAESVIDIYEKKYPDDKRPRNAIEAAKKVLKRDTKKNRAAAAYDAEAAFGAYSVAVWADFYAVAVAATYTAWVASTFPADNITSSDVAAWAAYAATYADGNTNRKKQLQNKIINYGIKIIKRNEPDTKVASET